MKNHTTEYDVMLSQAQTYTTELQGLLRALDASLDEFMNPVCCGQVSEEDKSVIMYGLIHEAKTIIGLMHSMQRTLELQEQEQDELYKQLIEGGKYE
jgi:hypothetical protein